MQCDVEMPTSGQAHPAADKLSASQSDVDLRYLEHATYHRIDVTRRPTCQRCAHSRRQLKRVEFWGFRTMVMHEITMGMLGIHGMVE